MKKQYEQNAEIHTCVLCDSQVSSLTYLGKAVCDDCLKYVKENY